jgi:MYXO-CTERM domain-containing protein
MDARIASLVLLAASSAAAQRTTLVVRPDAPDTPYAARYSQGLVLEAQLTADGAPVVGERVVFELAPTADPDASFVIEDPVTDGAGIARARLTLVDGRYGGQTFTGTGTTPDEATPYTVTATFLGLNPPTLGECQATDAGPAVDDGGPTRLCAAEDTASLRVGAELPSLVLDEVGEVSLGDTITLVATLVDPTGDAPQAGTALDGDGPVPIAGGTVSFFFDVDGNERPSLDERLGTDDTDESGIAVFELFLDPVFIDQGDFAQGVHVQYAGDERRFSVAGDSSRVNVLALDPVAAKTIIEVDPETVPADGFSTVKITVKLVDGDNGILDVNAPEYDVVVTTDLGTISDPAARDPLTGFYVAELKAARAGGTATIGVLVDGAPGPTAEVEFVKEGCACVSTSGPAPAAALVLLVVVARRRRR